MNNAPIKQTFATRLKALREKKGLTQTELANKIGISRGSISFYEKGERVADIEVLNRLCEYFGVSADYLIGTADIAAINEFMATNRYYKNNPELDAKALEIYRLTKECFSSFQTIYYNKYNSKNSDETDEYISKFCSILHAHLQIILSNYVELSENLRITQASDDPPFVCPIIQQFLRNLDINDIITEIIQEIFSNCEIF